MEIETNAKKLIESAAESRKDYIDKKVVAKAVKDAKRRDFADFAILGRMVADARSLMLEGAGSRAIDARTGERNRLFSAVNDTEPTDAAVAGHFDVLEANFSYCYCYNRSNVDLIFDDAHLGKVEKADKGA